MTEEKRTYKRSDVLRDKFTFCPGCHHSTVNKLIAEVLEELNIARKTILVIAVGCCAVMYKGLNLTSISAAHGRAPATATAIKRASPANLVFTYQGDGDLAAIGTNEIIHAANRGENFTTIGIINGLYGMTGGQSAPTSLIGQKTTTSPLGKMLEEGMPIGICELLDTLRLPYLIARTSCVSPAEILKTKKLIKKAFEYQLAGKGFTFIEVISNCPTYWKMTPLESLKYVKDEMLKQFPVGIFRDCGKEGG